MDIVLYFLRCVNATLVLCLIKSHFIDGHFNNSLLPGHSDALNCPEQNANVWSAVVAECLARHFGIISDLAGAKKMASISLLRPIHTAQTNANKLQQTSWLKLAVGFRIL